jgi:hypothetical protein
MKKTMNEVKRLIAIRQVNNALNIRNESSTAILHDLSLNSLILIYREDIEHSEA